MGRNQSILLRRVKEACNKHGCRTPDEAVQYLLSSFPDYTRMKQQTLMGNVRRAFQELQSPQGSSMKSVTRMKGSSNVEAEIGSLNRKINDSEEDEEGASDSSRATPCRSRKRKKRIDMKEEKLLRLEKEHLKRSRKIETESDTESETGLEDDEPTSSSDDAIYGMKFEPEFDLMKSMLRESYGRPKTESLKGEEKNLEVEDVSKEKRLAALARDGTGAKGLTPVTGRKKGGTKGSKRSVPVAEEEVIAKASGPMFSDLGGMKSVLEDLTMEVIVPLYHPQLSIWLGVRPVGGILLHGPPGCGKTKLAHAIANETGVPFYKISATEVVSGVSGASEENIREMFLKAEKTAPSIIFIDEIDAIASKRENLQREMERRIVTQLMTCMDDSHRHLASGKNFESESDQRKPGHILVIGATNRPDAVDPALRRPGRFDREISLGIPDESARAEILSMLTCNLRLEGDFDMGKIARATPGFVGADLEALTNKAGNLAMKRILDRRKSELTKESLDKDPVEEWWRKPWLPEEMQDLSITMADFEEATKMVQPSLKREGFSDIPNVKWEDVGGLDTLRQEFERFIVRRIKHPEIYEECGVDMETGFLLYGPPGCGKTLIAKAVAHEAGANFIHIKGPELLNKWVGESESAVRTLFRRARTCAPCIFFFDEVDAITKKSERDGGSVVESLLKQLLIELDGGENRKGVYVIGATNRRDVIDEATLRPGRFGKHLYVPLPSPEQRGLILQAVGRKKSLDDNVDLVAIGQSKSCDNFSGADLASLMNEAALATMEERISFDPDLAAPPTTPFSIKAEHFEQALRKVTPSVSDKQIRYYNRSAVSFKTA